MSGTHKLRSLNYSDILAWSVVTVLPYKSFVVIPFSKNIGVPVTKIYFAVIFYNFAIYL